MDLKKLQAMIRGGKIFSVEFIKRTDGTKRLMVARTGVKKHLSGNDTRLWQPADHNLVAVYDMQKRAYRHIPADSILRIRAGGKEYIPPQRAAAAF